jgi:glucose-6-phosphate dehydrogenase assembly protein OpcA
MAPAVTVATPAPLRYSHASGLNAVAEALESLHRELMRTNQENDRVRLSVANLVAACNDPDNADHAAETLIAIGARHPARAIVVVGNPAGQPLIEADLSLHCALADNRVCTELVRLHVEGEPAYHLVTIVVPLLIPDIPVHIWVVGAPPLTQAFSPETVSIAERIIVDTGAYAEVAETLTLVAQELEHFGAALSLGDVAWECIRGWRELTAQAFQGADTRPLLHQIDRVEVVNAGTAPSAQAWLMAGWLSTRLAWPLDGGPSLEVTAQPGDAPARDLLALRLHSAGTAHQASVVLERKGDMLTTSIDVEGGMTASRTVSFAIPDEAHRISRLMADPSGEHVYRQAVARAAELAARAAT